MGKNQANPESEIAAFIREVRKGSKLNQTDFAFKYNCTKGNVSGWERGRYEPSFAVLRTMSENWGVALPAQTAGVTEPATLSESAGSTVARRENVVTIEIALSVIGEALSGMPSADRGLLVGKFTSLVDAPDSPMLRSDIAELLRRNYSLRRANG
jgi:transcriptional regulator with XRE-family HTH domain